MKSLLSPNTSMQAVSTGHEPTASQQLIPGLIGMSPRTNAVYYLAMHEEGDRLLGTPVAFRSVLVSPDFDAMIRAIECQDRSTIEEMLLESARRAIAAGADFIVLLSNTGSTFADVVSRQCGAPVLGIVEPVVRAARAAGRKKVGLISTAHTARSAMYADTDPAGIEFLLPDEQWVEAINGLIVKDIALGNPTEDSRQEILRAVEALREAGADAVALACTDLTLLRLEPEDVSLPLLDSTLLHAAEAARVAVHGW